MGGRQHLMRASQQQPTATKEAKVAQRDDVLKDIRRHTGHDHVLAVPRAFITLTGDIYCAALLAQLLYWTDRASNRMGWVYKTRSEWCEELGGTRWTLDAARQRLRDLGLIEESCHMVNNKRTLHMRLLVSQLRSALEPSAAAASTPPPASGKPARTDPAPDAPPPSKPTPEELAPSSNFRPLHLDRLLQRMRARQAAQSAALV